MIKILKHRKKMNKKGIFFTILAIALLSLFVVSYSVYSFAQNREGIGKRIKTMNSYVSSLEEDIPRKLYITGYRIIFLFNQRIIDSGSYIADVNTSFSEAFFNGTIDDIDYRNDNLRYLDEATFPDIVEKINNVADSLNLNVTFINPKASISQEDPWHVKVTLESNLIIKDRGNLALWNKTSVLSAYIPITNFEDPLYTKNTNATVVNKFNQTIYPVPISADNIVNHATNSYYINHTDAPSFLQRFEGDLTADPNGIESLINPYELAQQGISVKDRCIIDYLYFSQSGCGVQQTYSGWIKIDQGHMGIYGAAA